MRTIQVTVHESSARKDAASAGVQGEGNVTALRITFDESWDLFAKKITWWNASGENPVEVILGADSLEDITQDTRTYLSKIPAEPLELAGTCLAVIDGYLNGSRARSVPMQFKVLAAAVTDNAAEPVDPTPSQAEQLQEEIDGLLGNIQTFAVEAKSYAVGGTGSREGEDTDNAKYYASQAETGAQQAKEASESAKTDSETAQEAADAAVLAAEAAQRSEAAAEKSADAALSAVGKTSYIGENGNWFEWRDGGFVDTGVAATALIDQSSGESIRIWFGTVAEYNALPEIRHDTYYNILEGEP